MVSSGRKSRHSHFFNSFFFTKLLENGSYNYRNVKRWSKKVEGKDVFELDKILVPVNVSNMHWCCLCVHVQERVVQFYDSLGGSGLEYLEAMRGYLRDEWSKLGKPGTFDEAEWDLVPTTSNTPRQKNGYDCGVFTSTCADFLSLGVPLTYTQEDIGRCRRRIAMKILDGPEAVSLD